MWNSRVRLALTGALVITIASIGMYNVFVSSQPTPAGAGPATNDLSQVDAAPHLLNQSEEALRNPVVVDEPKNAAVSGSDAAVNTDSARFEPYFLANTDFGFDFYHLVAIDDKARLRRAFSRPPFVNEGETIKPELLERIVTEHFDECVQLKQLSSNLLRATDKFAREKFKLGAGEPQTRRTEQDRDGTLREVGELPQRRHVGEMVSLVSDGAETRVVRTGWNEHAEIDDMRTESRAIVEGLINSVRNTICVEKNSAQRHQ